MALFRFNHYGLTTNKFSTDIVGTLRKRNGFSMGRCAKFVKHVRCPTVISHPILPYHMDWIRIFQVTQIQTKFTLNLRCFTRIY